MSNTWQLGALMKKNWILMKRSCCTTCCEILFPIILMILMVLVRRAIKVETYIEPTDMDSFLQSNSTALLDPSTLMDMQGQNKSNWNGLTIRSAL
jgi:ATP-binding cassette subfamily A (ABC1) protein 3